MTPVLMLVAALCALLMIAMRWVLDQWNEHAQRQMTAEQRAPTAVDMLRHSINDSDAETARASAQRRATFAAERTRRLDAASSKSAAALIMSSATPISASASASSLSIARQQARLAELRAQGSPDDQRHPPEDSPWSIIGAHRRRAREQAAVDAIAGAMDSASASASASSVRSDSDQHEKAFLEEIPSDDDAAEERKHRAPLDADESATSLLLEDSNEEAAPVDQALMVSEGQALMQLLRSAPGSVGASNNSSVAALRDPDSGAYLSLHRALVRYASLLGALPPSSLNAWSAAICGVFVRARGFDRLEFVMQHATAAAAGDSSSSSASSSPFELQKRQALDIESTERAMEMKLCAERILHTLVPLVWTA